MSISLTAAHYGTAVLPTRPRRPRDRAKVEACVLIVERWLIGRLRDRRFYSLAELNAAIGELLRHLNEERPIRRLGITRRQLLEELDRPALKPLPTEPYVFAEWRPDLLYSTMLGLGEKPLKRREFITREAASKVPTVAFAFGAKRGSNARQAFDHRCFHRDPHASHHAVRPS